MSIYLDNSATTKVRPEVLEAMLPFLQDKFGNPSSIHAKGREARAAMDRARQETAELIGCEPNEIYFCFLRHFGKQCSSFGAGALCRSEWLEPQPGGFCHRASVGDLARRNILRAAALR
jgi:hypothetical protein